MKKCQQCKYQKYNHVRNYWYCEVAELNDDIANYWDNDDDEGECYGFNNDYIISD